MELRQYWHILVRRRNVVLYTFLIALVFSAITEAYGYFTNSYMGKTTIGFQVQPDYRNGSVADPQVAANTETDQVIIDVTTYSQSKAYFDAMSAALKRGYGIKLKWKTLHDGLAISLGPHFMLFQWPVGLVDQGQAVPVVTVASHLLLDYVPVYLKTLHTKHTPAVDATVIDPPYWQRVSYSKSVTNFVLRVTLGLVAGLILAYLFEYLDPMIQDETDVQRWLDLPTLAVIPDKRWYQRARSA